MTSTHRRKHNANTVHTDCVLCAEPVTNPICQDCLAQAITQWLHEASPERIAGLQNETEALRAPNGVACVHCHKAVGVCTYCYTRHVFNWLKDGALQLEFVAFFNFDFYQPEPYTAHVLHSYDRRITP